MKKLVAAAVTCLALLAGCGGEMSMDAGVGGGGGTTGGGGGSSTGGGGGSSTGGGGGTADAGASDAGTADAGVTDAGTLGNIVAVASSDPQFSTLVAAITKAELAATLSDPSGNFTVFAPTNAAFAALLTALNITNGLDGLTKEQLVPILKYHVLGTRVGATAATAAATANQAVTSLGGQVKLSLSGSTIRLDSRASVTTADVQASNGVIHVIDNVILPSIADIATTTPALSSLVAAATLADTNVPSPGLAAALDDDAAPKVTVFAPTNAAFDALVTALKGTDDGGTTGISALTSFRPDQVLPVLTYHVVPSQVLSTGVPTTATAVDTLGGKVSVLRSGTAVTVDGTSVVTADLLASNGVVHVIGQVLLPSITDVVTTDARFTSLKAAVVTADSASGTAPKVGEALNGSTSFTLFAPTNAAFTALGAAPSGQALTDVLLYHAVPSAPVYAATALALTAPTPLATALTSRSITVAAEGSPTRVTVADGTSIKGNVTITNLFTANGVIHAVDKVLIP